MNVTHTKGICELIFVEHGNKKYQSLHKHLAHF
jgi:hypothetical protein